MRPPPAPRGSRSLLEGDPEIARHPPDRLRDHGHRRDLEPVQPAGIPLTSLRPATLSLEQHQQDRRRQREPGQSDQPAEHPGPQHADRRSPPGCWRVPGRDWHSATRSAKIPLIQPAPPLRRTPRRKYPMCVTTGPPNDVRPEACRDERDLQQRAARLVRADRPEPRLIHQRKPPSSAQRRSLNREPHVAVEVVENHLCDRERWHGQQHAQQSQHLAGSHHCHQHDHGCTWTACAWIREA